SCPAMCRRWPRRLGPPLPRSGGGYGRGPAPGWEDRLIVLRGVDRRNHRRALAVVHSPDRSLQLEPIDIDHTAPRGRAFAAGALMDEAAFLQHAPRGGVLDPRRCENLDRVSQKETRVHDRRRRFAGVALTPGLWPERIAQSQPALQPTLDADHAERLA